MSSKRGSRNRSARRASLGSLVDRVKSSSRRTRTAAKPSAAGTRRSRVAKRQSSLAPRTVVVGTLCVVAAAALIMSRQSSIVNWVAEVDAAGNIQRVEQVDHFDPAQVTLPETAEVAPRASTRAVSLTTTPAPAAKREPAPVAPAPATFTHEPALAEPVSKVVATSLRSTEVEPEPAASPSSTTEHAEAAVPATIAGCLERNADTFWLKDTSGADAPKSRSWKSGFLRKKSSTVELTDKGATNRLAAYVGRRIETSGVLVDREMRIKTLRVLGSCD